MAMAASPALPNLHTVSLNAAAGSKLRSRVDCCAVSSSNSGSSNSGGSRFSCAATRLLVPAPYFPIPAFEVAQDEDGDDEELTFIDYEDEDDGNKANSWLTPQYLSFRLRCSSLMQQEASDALRRHFKGRKSVATSSKTKIADETQETYNSTQPQKHKEPNKNRHHRLQLVSGSYVGAQGTVDFITDVVISDTQNAYFDNLTMREPAKACN